MKCPHCHEHIHVEADVQYIGEDVDGHWSVRHSTCPACERLFCHLVNGDVARTPGGRYVLVTTDQEQLIRPKGALRPAPPKEVPTHLAEDYIDACLVLPDSPKASAALSRRCLQHLLLDAAKVKSGDLVKQIQEVLDSGKLPTQIADSIDAVRNIGNFAAHPSKSQSTGEIVAVEPGEGEWNLDILEMLFDFYYVQPALIKAKKDATLYAEQRSARC